jgi:uncharacterized protein (TIGR02452 family)
MVDQRNSRRQIAEQTLQELNQGYYANSKGQSISIDDDVQHSIDGSRLYVKAELDLLLSNRKPHSNRSVVLVTRHSTLQCLISVSSEQKKIALLNFASAKNAGGGFLGGSQAQEESLARSSSLYPTLIQNKKYYESNKRAPNTFYIDNLIYSPQVVFFKNDEGKYLDHYVKADVITMPAVNKGALKFVDEQVQREIDDVMKQRIRYVLAVSEKNNVDTLILGAWGCGVFRNNPQNIADNFRHVLTENPGFDVPRIIFAIFDRGGETYHAFESLSSV